MSTPTADGTGNASPTDAACTTPSQEVLDWASLSISTHPGSIEAAALAHAASTSTGEWYVIGIDRQYAYDNGSTTGSAPRISH